MKGLTFHGKETLKYETVADPAIEDSQDVIVKVDLAGICGSDLHPYLEREKGLDYGTVMGHEFVGEVVEAGRSVAGLSAGDRVFSPFTTNCGECFYCRTGLTCRCTRGQLFRLDREREGAARRTGRTGPGAIGRRHPHACA